MLRISNQHKTIVQRDCLYMICSHISYSRSEPCGLSDDSTHLLVLGRIEWLSRSPNGFTSTTPRHLGWNENDEREMKENNEGSHRSHIKHMKDAINNERMTQLHGNSLRNEGKLPRKREREGSAREKEGSWESPRSALTFYLSLFSLSLSIYFSHEE